MADESVRIPDRSYDGMRAIADRFLFASIQSGLDPCSGGALAAREMLERLAGRGALLGALGRRDRPGRQRRPGGVHANGVKPRRALTGPERATEFRALERASEMWMASPELRLPGTCNHSPKGQTL